MRLLIIAALLCLPTLTFAQDASNAPQFKRAVERYIASFHRVNKTLDEGGDRPTIFGDIDGDGDDDAVVMFYIVPRHGNSTGIEIALFINNKGVWRGVTDEPVGGQLWQDFKVTAVKRGAIIGKASYCGDEKTHQMCLEGQTPDKEWQVEIPYRRGKLIVPKDN